MNGSAAFPSMIFRPAKESDAAALIALGHKVLDDGSTVHLLQPGETLDSIDEQTDLIHWYQAAPNRQMLVVESGPGELAGQVTAFGGTYTADQGTAVLTIEVAPDWRRKGIGTRLLAEIEIWAQKQGIHRLELTVLVDNIPARSLYAKSGFVEEGQKRASRKLHRHYFDEIIMAKILGLS